MTGVVHHHDAFEHERSRLVGLAYRITGSRTEADDIVQDAWLRWNGTDRGAIERPAAWLTTVTSRLAIDRLRSARNRRETYVGPWLPEPTTLAPDPAEGIEAAESLTIGFLAVLERLSPTERVVFLLSDVFGVPFADIAEAVDKTPDACRQVASRARRRVREDRPRFAPTDDDAWRIAVAFLSAAQQGDTEGLVGLLGNHAVAVSDGGATVRAARRPIVAERIPRFLVNLTRRGLAAGDDVVPVAINAQPGVTVTRRGRITLAMVVAVADGRIDRVWTVLNPAKLAALDAELHHEGEPGR
jgi:RNA polymerase sigma-70 factor (ECF subfamily)